MNKTIFSILFIFTFMLTSCSASKPTTDSSALEIFNMVKNEADIDEPVVYDLSKLEYASNYGILSDDVEEGYVCLSSDNLEADELFVVKGKDDNAVENIERALGNEIISLTNGYESKDDEYYDVKNHVFRTKDKYVLLYVGDKPDEVENTFNSVF